MAGHEQRFAVRRVAAARARLAMNLDKEDAEALPSFLCAATDYEKLLLAAFYLHDKDLGGSEEFGFGQSFCVADFDKDGGPAEILKHASELESPYSGAHGHGVCAAQLCRWRNLLRHFGVNALEKDALQDIRGERPRDRVFIEDVHLAAMAVLAALQSGCRTSRTQDAPRRLNAIYRDILSLALDLEIGDE